MKTIKLVLFALLALIVLGTLAAAAPAQAVSGAVYTTVDEKVDGKGHCKNGNPGVNCNIYDGKQYVWLNGGPASNGLSPDGMYFFAVLVPGGQPDPNDGGAKNLSDDYDAYTNRTFTVTNGEVSAYTGDHWFDSGKGGPKGVADGKPPFIRLYPYADTTNPGGVYIMAVCYIGPDGSAYPVAPRSCKYDAFKVQKGKVQVSSELSGYKYRDDNKNGQMDLGELGLAGWQIKITLLDGTPVTTLTTDANGYWQYDTPLHSPLSGTTTYKVCEVQQAGWKQTGNTVDQSIATNGASVVLSSFCYTVTFPNDSSEVVSMLNFGNIPQGQVSGGKYYDANGNGQWDSGEAWLAGWKINYDSAQVVTDSQGKFSLTLDPNTYLFQEVQGWNDGVNGWFQTGNTVNQSKTTGGATGALAGFKYTVVIPNNQPSTVTGLYFGNVCKWAPGGRTPGFWQNNNGQALITADDLAALRALNLVNEDGSPFDPTTKEQVAAWILSDAGQNMAYKLSSFVAAVTLNVRHGFTDPNVYANGQTVAYWLNYANTLLGQDPLTPPGDEPMRSQQAAVKDILDKVANGASFVQPNGDKCGAPYH
jgi:hypothetical protein